MWPSKNSVHYLRALLVLSELSRKVSDKSSRPLFFNSMRYQPRPRAHPDASTHVVRYYARFSIPYREQIPRSAWSVMLFSLNWGKIRSRKQSWKRFAPSFLLGLSATREVVSKETRCRDGNTEGEKSEMYGKIFQSKDPSLVQNFACHFVGSDSVV